MAILAGGGCRLVWLSRCCGLSLFHAGEPLVTLVPLEPHQTQPRLGFLQGQAVIDADLKAHFSAEIESMFEA